jgi:hypothetical protein
MHRFLLPLTVLGLLLSGFPFLARGYFEQLETIEEQTQEAGTGDLDALLEELAEEETPPTFSDIPADAWYASYVGKVAEWGIVSGYKTADGERTGYFGPDDPVTVSQMLKIAFEAARMNSAGCTGRPDHPQALGHWAERYVRCGEIIRMRILRTTPDLDRPARRGEVLSIVHDAFGEILSSGAPPFSDTAGHRYEADIGHAFQRGIVSGYTTATGAPTGQFGPDDPVTRAQAAKIIVEMLKAEYAEGDA